MTLALFLLTALALGMRHALEPDHLVAVSTLVAEEKRLWPAARLGMIWGIGHLMPLLLLGLPVLLLRLELPASLENSVDLFVGLLLVALGVRSLWLLRRERVHFHKHVHDGGEHAHFHAHARSHGHRHAHEALGALRSRREMMTLGIGMIHGLAGSGAAALLALTAAPGVRQGVLYLIVFGIGTCAGMFATTLCIAAPALSAVSRFTKLHSAARGLAGCASIGVGLYLWREMLPKLLA